MKLITGQSIDVGGLLGGGSITFDGGSFKLPGGDLVERMKLITGQSIDFGGLLGGGSITFDRGSFKLPGFDIGGQISIDAGDPDGWVLSSTLTSEPIDVEGLLGGGAITFDGGSFKLPDEDLAERMKLITGESIDFEGLLGGGAITFDGGSLNIPGFDIGGQISIDAGDPDGWVLSSTLTSEPFGRSRLLEDMHVDEQRSDALYSTKEQLEVAGLVTLGCGALYGSLAMAGALQVLAGVLLTLAWWAATETYRKLR